MATCQGSEEFASVYRQQLFEFTYQLRKLVIDDVFDREVVYLVMTAQLLRNCGFAHRWWSDQAKSDWL